MSWASIPPVVPSVAEDLWVDSNVGLQTISRDYHGRHAVGVSKAGRGAASEAGAEAFSTLVRYAVLSQRLYRCARQSASTTSSSALSCLSSSLKCHRHSNMLYGIYSAQRIPKQRCRHGVIWTVEADLWQHGTLTADSLSSHDMDILSTSPSSTRLTS